MNASIPTVSLVGAGPGDPELLTVRALKRLQEADVVLTDDLVDARVLALLRPETRVLRVGKRGGCISTEQRFIHELMIREARSGARVVRLKGGDPFVFGRGGEEVTALREAGIEVEVVSGLTAGIAAPASIGIPVTDRRHAPGVAFVTGHRQDGEDAPDWAALARSGLSLVIYMGLARAEELVASLRAGGLDPRTPAAVIAAAHTAQQRQAICTLESLPATLKSQRIASPAILVIGTVVNEAWQVETLPGLQLSAVGSC
ncbi:uroporphyrinogen-III C-methyltransferase [Pelomonas sp. SE-A7]|uniref:uroporphyrinogen-III C-methyltransferase n=1 Tax=Pelomonas sp. SE-A7 TaxID=3054953 RepID=UPI00259D2823|nr:uroporphyrinogen-III C-methyltransferase [Pelomonas sp. SE-A7]MDM4767911.1 uroporphyrinogen-III C-methyltransferase [Pelomonas sp. SE-A7]